MHALVVRLRHAIDNLNERRARSVRRSVLRSRKLAQVQTTGLDRHVRPCSVPPHSPSGTMTDPAGSRSDVDAGGVGNGDEGDVTVRDATREDMPAVHAMIHELAMFEGVPEGPQLSVEDLIADGFESSPTWFFAVVAERRGVILGYALCNRAYSSWTRRAMYLEDLYVSPAARRGRVGLRLIRHVCARAAAECVSRIDWHVLENNESARTFYSSLGARDLRLTEGRTAMRLDETHIQRLATEHQEAQ